MSEKQINSPEVNTATVQDLYQQRIDVFGNLNDALTTKPGHSATHIDLIQQVEVTPMNGRRIVLEWERPAKEDDPTAVDNEIPLEWYDETGKNHWHTPIEIKVYDETSGAELHDYSIARATHQAGEDPTHVWAFDYHRDVGDPGLYESEDDVLMTSLDAKELIAHMEWALENAPH